MQPSTNEDMDFKALAVQASNYDERAFRKIYDHTSGKMYSLCLRYTSNTEDANDVLQEGYLKVFRSLQHYKGEGTFEGWVRRIFVTTCLDFIKKKRLHFFEIDEEYHSATVTMNGIDKLNIDDLLKLIRQLPNGYRTVFNLYIIEGYSHNEISKMLEMEVSTSKSQLTRAKKYLKELISKETKNTGSFVNTRA